MITSKFTTRFIVTQVLYLAVIAFVIGSYAWVALTDDFHNYSRSLWTIAPFILVLIGLYFKNQYRYLHRSTVTNEGITLKHLLTGKTLHIKYDDIDAVELSRVGYITNFFIKSYYIADAHLTSGKQVSYSDYAFSNYEELNDAICERAEEA